MKGSREMDAEVPGGSTGLAFSSFVCARASIGLNELAACKELRGSLEMWKDPRSVQCELALCSGPCRT